MSLQATTPTGFGRAASQPAKPASPLESSEVPGSMATAWHGLVNPPRPGTVREWRYDDRDITLRKGEEMGRFLLGSTVVMLFRRGTLQFPADWVPARAIRMGEPMAR